MRGKRPARAEVPDKTPHLFTSPPHAGGGSEQLSAISGFAVTNQREMPHRRHRAALGQADAAVFAAQSARRAHGNSGRQPSRRANGANPSSKTRRGPLSAPM